MNNITYFNNGFEYDNIFFSYNHIIAVSNVKKVCYPYGNYYIKYYCFDITFSDKAVLSIGYADMKKFKIVSNISLKEAFNRKLNIFKYFYHLGYIKNEGIENFIKDDFEWENNIKNLRNEFLKYFNNWKGN